MHERLDDERESISRNANVFGYKMKQIFGYNKYGDLKEVQFFAAKRGTLIWEYCQVVSLLISKNLQYGVSADSIAKKLEGFVSDPSGNADGGVYEGFANYFSYLLKKYKKME